MKRWIDSILHTKDDYLNGLMKAFVLLLKDNNKEDIINFKPGDPYWNAFNQEKMLGNQGENEDILVESY